MTLGQAIAMIPKGWGFEIRSYETGDYSCELWRFRDMPLAESNGPVVRAAKRDLSLAISAAANKAIKYSDAQ